MNLDYWLKRPHLIPARIIYWIWEKYNPEKPWLCPGTERFCDRYLSNSMIGVEFGSGRSTLWFAQKLGKLTSIEHSSQWHAQIKTKLEQMNIDNVDYRLVTNKNTEPGTVKNTDNMRPRYVSILNEFENDSLDFILIDGQYRVACIQYSLEKLKSGGLLVVDDVNVWNSLNDLPIPANWLIVNKSSNGIKKTYIWEKPIIIN